MNNYNTIKINDWFGRLGNNIIQVHNAILIGLFYNMNISLPTHNFFIKKDIILNDDKQNDEHVYFTDNYNFFFREYINNIDNNLFTLNYDKSIKILKDIFLIKPYTYDVLDDNDLIIYIRSGDIFNDSSPHHPEYIQPPLYFYINIINNNSFNNIYLISEDKGNPNIDKLLELYPYIKYNKNSLIDDIKIILGAKNITDAIGTFIYSLLFISDNIKKLYRFSNDEYRNLLYPWQNTCSQKQIMLTYENISNSIEIINY